MPRGSRNPRKNPNLRQAQYLSRTWHQCGRFCACLLLEWSLFQFVISKLSFGLLGWKGHLGFGWGGMEEEEEEMKGKGGGEESNLPCQKCSHRNQSPGLVVSPFPRGVKIQGLKWGKNETGEILGLLWPLRKIFQGIRDYKIGQKEEIMGIIQGVGNDSWTFWKGADGHFRAQLKPAQNAETITANSHLHLNLHI